MGFPAGAQTITITGNFPIPVGGAARKGQIVFTPSARLVDSTQKAIYSGGGPAKLGDDGKFSVVLLCTDDADVKPAGWRWRVDEQPSGGPRDTYWIDLPSTLGPTVDLSVVAKVSAPDGSSGGSQTATPVGPAGGALTGTYPNPQLSTATIAAFDAAGAASAAQAAATTAAATDATAKVAAHTAASDPHGDRAVAAAALAAHEADTTSVHGIPNTALLETSTGAQSKADAAQAAATSAAATDATAKVTAHSADTTDVHGIADTAVLETQTGAQTKASAAQTAATTAAATDATSKVSAHAVATDPHGDRAWADNKFATQLDLTSLAGTVNTLDGFLNNALTRIQAVEQGTAYLAGGHFTADVEVIDADLTVRGASVVLTSEDQVINGEKTFNTAIPVGPAFDPAFDNQLTRKAYVDAAIASAGGGSTIRSATARIVDGAIVDLPAAASWVIAETSVGTQLKCSIPAAAGDRIRLDGDFMRAGAHFLDWALLDSAGAIAVYGTTRSSTPPAEGSPSMYPSTSFSYVQASKQFVVSAGHINAGQATIALAHQGVASGKVYAHSTYPFELMLTNLGPEPA